MFPKLTVVGKTDKGLVRSGNEDYLHLDDNNHVYAVCDGMGGHQAGEVASMTASQTIERAFNQFSVELLGDSQLKIDRTLPASGDLLLKAIRLANRMVYQKASEDPALSGMGTTIVSLAFEADILSIAHVGDSRAYRLESRQLVPLTKDHSWIVEMQENQQISEDDANSLVAKNVITRALGVKDTVEVDYRLIKVKPGDTFILCSDGLCGFADDDEIYDVAAKHHDDLNKMVDNLVQMANDRGGNDNVTVIAVHVDEVRESPLPEVELFTLASEAPSILDAEDDWILRFVKNDEEKTEEKKSDAEEESGNKLLVFAIFALFVIVAAVIIYITQSD